MKAVKSPKKKSTSVSRRKYQEAIDKQDELRAALQGLSLAAQAMEEIDDATEFQAVEAVSIGLGLALKQATISLGGAEWNDWGEWKVAEGASAFPDLPEATRPKLVWHNKVFEVFLHLSHMHDDPANPVMAELSIKRFDRLPIDYNHWRTLQRIKDELLGPDFDAAALYPCAERLVDSCNQYRLYAMPRGLRMPFGDHSRIVSSRAVGVAVQRPFEPGQAPEDDIASDPDKMAEVASAVSEAIEGSDD